jgi:hypothetical protein
MKERGRVMGIKMVYFGICLETLSKTKNFKVAGA